MRLASGFCEDPYTCSSRFEKNADSNPEESVGAAHAGCFSKFLAALPGDKGFEPETVSTSAIVHLAAKAKEECPMSMASASVKEITPDATLLY